MWNVNSKLLNGTKKKTATEATSIRERESTVFFFCKFSLGSLGQCLCNHHSCNCKLNEGGVRWVDFLSILRHHDTHPATDITRGCPALPNNAAKCFFSAEGTMSVPAVQPHCQDWLHPWGGHTGGPVRILEALRGAVIGHWQLALLGGQVLSAATEGPDQDGHRQEKEGASGGHYVIPVDGQGRHRNASPWWRDTEWLASGKKRGVALVYFSTFNSLFSIPIGLHHTNSKRAPHMSMHKHARCKKEHKSPRPKKKRKN